MEFNQKLSKKLEKIEELEHTADVKYRVMGENLQEAFELCGFCHGITVTNLHGINPIEEVEFQIQSEDLESLLYDFLSELIYIFDTTNILISNFTFVDIKKEDESFLLQIKGLGEKFDIEKHEIGTEIKAMTYSEMNISVTENDFSKPASITIVFDI